MFRNIFRHLISSLSSSRYLDKRNVDILMVTIGMVLGIRINWPIEDILVLSVIVWAILNPWPSINYAKLSLYFLGLIPVVLLLDNHAYAEKFAIYTYYFLILTVVMAAIELHRDKDDDPDTAQSD